MQFERQGTSWGEPDNPPLRLHTYHRDALRPIGHPMAFLLWALNIIWGE
jgi:hypothetical protein